MSLIVQKFGGTSVADSQKILAAARKAIRAQQEGHQVVMVVSAMGARTDQLVALAAELSDEPPAREMDMLLSTGEQVSVALMAMAVDSLGAKGISLTGAQIGIQTDSSHTKARIKAISTERIQRLLGEGNIVIAAGFQGIDEDFNITTLGRGGSDTTAVALAAVLGANQCEIYTDVDGVYTTDPRVMPEARCISHISYEEMLELASLGAGVMHSRAVEFGKKFGVPIHVRNSFTDITGSLIVSQPEVDGLPVSGAAMTKNEARVTLLGVPDVPGSSLAIFSRLADQAITVDMIVQNVGIDGKADISFTVLESDLESTLEAVEDAKQALDIEQITHDSEVAKISVVGLGMAEQIGVANKMFRSLSQAEVNIQMITTSEIKISVLVDRKSALTALRAVHQEFQLEKPPWDEKPVLPEICQPPQNALEVVKRLQVVGMEDLTIDTVELDDDQARITILGVPDRPGVASDIFDRVAHENVFVDMIVQSYDGNEGTTSLSFTIPKEHLTLALKIANKICQEFDCATIQHSETISKLSVSGLGLRSHTDVAIRMFQSLFKANLNVSMVSTSEVRVNVVIEGDKGQIGLRSLQEAFADVLR
ncbi:MAG: aspartate kinase [Pirellulaceae bacterium]|nr:aspartate kinase [Pirellulaceae bacterium]